jgi:transposase-like protein
VLIALGIDDKGKREVLGVQVSLSEAEVYWREFLGDLQKRGMHGTKLIFKALSERKPFSRQLG